jgi:hypothetical protein
MLGIRFPASIEFSRRAKETTSIELRIQDTFEIAALSVISPSKQIAFFRPYSSVKPIFRFKEITFIESGTQAIFSGL